MRLDVFMPFLRKPPKGRPPRQPNALTRALTKVLPAPLFSTTTPPRPGLARKFLKKLGPTWLYAPVRRAVQTLCFITFLVLFFYVCWPYGAQPARSWSGWTPADIAADTGAATLRAAGPADPAIRDGGLLHVTDDAAEPAQRDLGAFRVRRIDGGALAIEPAATPSPELLERMSFSLGPWSLHEAAPGAWPSHHADYRASKENLHAEFFLIIDPLVSLSTAVAGRAWVWSLVWAAGILLIGVLVPRGFCGYLCPLGTLIDLFDWAIGKRVTRFNVAGEGWWVHIKYYLLAGTMLAAVMGVLVSGFFSAIPVITRGLLFTVAPLVQGTTRGWHQVPPLHAGHIFSIALFFAVLGLGLLRPRFWCKYVCPSGAVFSVGNLFRASERKVESTCINCNKCVEVCPFDAIKPDFTTRTSDCTLCQTCGGVCPTHAIKFVGRSNTVELKINGVPATNETPLGRRGFIAAGVGLAAAAVGSVGLTAATKVFGANLDNPNALRPIRPPGSVPEADFLNLCIRCGECFKACPNDVLQPMGFGQGLEGLWTPHVVADWAGCDSSCNNCGQVCPTGAIRALPLLEKKAAHIGLAIVNPQTCLPHAGKEACQLCVDECVTAGYNAIEFIRVGTQADAQGNPIEDTGYLAPVVQPDRCVGCGLCQTRCYGINVQEKKLLTGSAIVIEAGPGKEDRISRGSYIALHLPPTDAPAPSR